MKNYVLSTLALLMILCQTGLVQARSNPLERAMERYARDLVRAYPELTEGKRSSEVRDGVVEVVNKEKLLYLSKDEEKKLRKKDSMVNEASYSEVLELIKALASEKPDEQFLIKYASEEGQKAAERLLAYRLLKRKEPVLTARLTNQRQQRLTLAYRKHVAYKEDNGEAASTLADLDLLEEEKFELPAQAKELGWLYFPDPKNPLKMGSTVIILVEPVGFQDVRYCALSSGRLVKVKEEQISAVLESFKEKSGEMKSPKREGAKVAGSTEAKKQKVKQVDYSVKSSLTRIMAKIMAYKKANGGKLPDSLDDLNLAELDKKFIDIKARKRMDWIYYGASSKLKVGGGQVIIILAPVTSGKAYWLGLSNGQIGQVGNEQASAILD